MQRTYFSKKGSPVASSFLLWGLSAYWQLEEEGAAFPVPGSGRKRLSSQPGASLQEYTTVVRAGSSQIRTEVKEGPLSLRLVQTSVGPGSRCSGTSQMPSQCVTWGSHLPLWSDGNLMSPVLQGIVAESRKQRLRLERTCFCHL